MKRLLLGFVLCLVASSAMGQDCSNGICNRPIAKIVKGGFWLPTVEVQKEVVSKKTVVKQKTYKTKLFRRLRIFR